MTRCRNEVTNYMNENKMYVPIEHKLALTVEEASLYSNIGQNRISKLLRAPNCPFALFVGNKKLVKRKEFETYVGRIREI